MASYWVKPQPLISGIYYMWLLKQAHCAPNKRPISKLGSSPILHLLLRLDIFPLSLLSHRKVVSACSSLGTAMHQSKSSNSFDFGVVVKVELSYRPVPFSGEKEVIQLSHWRHLPLEVLQIVFLFLDRRALIRMTHACRFFRRLAIGYSRLWTILGNFCQTYDELTAYLERSRGMPLTLFVTYDAPDLDVHPVCATYFADFMRLALPHAGRWERFEFVFNSTESGSEFPDDLFSQVGCAELELPRLRRLGIDCGPSINFLPIDAWRAPQLIDISCRNTISTWIMGESVTHFRFDYSPPEMTHLDVEHILLCLDNLPSLVILALRFGYCGAGTYSEGRGLIVYDSEDEEEDSELRPIERVKLTKLQDLQLTIIGRDDSKDLQALMRAIEAPALRSLGITLSTFRGCCWVQSLIPDDAARVWPILETVNIVEGFWEPCTDISADRSGWALFIALARLPQVRQVHFGSPYTPLLAGAVDLDYFGDPQRAGAPLPWPACCFSPRLERLVLRHTRERCCVAHCPPAAAARCAHESAVCVFARWLLRNTRVRRLEFRCDGPGALLPETVRRLGELGGDRVGVSVRGV